MLKAGALKISKYPTPAKLVSPFLLPLSGSGELPMSASAWMGGVWGRTHTCICMAEALHCSSETIPALIMGYIPI